MTFVELIQKPGNALSDMKTCWNFCAGGDERFKLSTSTESVELSF